MDNNISNNGSSRMAKEGIAERQYIVVSGTKRSGTSAMMYALRECGVPVIGYKYPLVTTDEKGRPIIDKVNPFVTSPGIFTYHGIGDFLGHAFRIGKEITPRND